MRLEAFLRWRDEMDEGEREMFMAKAREQHQAGHWWCVYCREFCPVALNAEVEGCESLTDNRADREAVAAAHIWGERMCPVCAVWFRQRGRGLF